MALPLALASILGGLGQGAQNIQQQHQQAQEMERQKARDALLERQVTSQEEQAKLQSELTRHKMGEEERSLKRGGMLADILSATQGVPTEAPELRPEGAMYSEATPIISKLPREMQVAMATLRTHGDKPDVVKPLMDYLYRKPEAYNLSAGQTRFVDGKPVASLPAEPKQPHFTEDAQGNVYAVTMGPNGPISTLVPGAKGKGRDPKNPTAPHYVEGPDGTITAITMGANGPEARVVPGVKGKGQDKTLPGGQVEGLSDMKSMIDQIKDAQRLYKPEYVGPVAGRTAGWQEATVGLDEQQTEFRTLINGFSNQLLRLRSGAAVTPQEYDRIKAELPQVNDPPKTFESKMRVAQRLLEQAYNNRRAGFTQTGFRIGDAPAAPGEAPKLRVPETPPQAQPSVERWERGPDGKLRRAK